ncbi:hypothetical protein D3C79_765050 [compost metagenome]
MRFCFEIVAYRQLKQYGDIIPGTLVKEWRADKIIKLLASFDPTSDQTGKVAIGAENDPDNEPETWIDIGTIESISWKKFRKYYSKLGSFLHAPKDSTAKSPLASSLDEILRELARVESNSIIVAIKEVRHADCPDCQTRVFVGESEFGGEDLIVCSNTKCNLPFVTLITDDGEKRLVPVTVLSFPCECSARIPVRREAIWAPFSCPNCFKEYRVNLAATRVSPT